jgi:uncharacterized protein YbdZ (MbtH family)
MIPVYVIHLPNAERKAKIAAELESNGFTESRYVAAQEPANGFTMSNMRRNARGEFGCSLSHLKAIATAAADGRSRALFIEDDVVFIGAERLMDALAELPTGWRVLYLGGHPRSEIQRYSPHLVTAGLWSFAEGYILNRASMLEFLTFWPDHAGQPDAMVDLVLGRFAAQGNSYCIYPTMTHQPVGWSQIGGKVDDKSGCLEKGWRTHLNSD